MPRTAVYGAKLLVGEGQDEGPRPIELTPEGHEGLRALIRVEERDRVADHPTFVVVDPQNHVKSMRKPAQTRLKLSEMQVTGASEAHKTPGPGQQEHLYDRRAVQDAKAAVPAHVCDLKVSARLVFHVIFKQLRGCFSLISNGFRL